MHLGDIFSLLWVFWDADEKASMTEGFCALSKITNSVRAQNDSHSVYCVTGASHTSAASKEVF